MSCNGFRSPFQSCRQVPRQRQENPPAKTYLRSQFPQKGLKSNNSPNMGCECPEIDKHKHQCAACHSRTIDHKSVTAVNFRTPNYLYKQPTLKSRNEIINPAFTRHSPPRDILELVPHSIWRCEQ